MKTFFAILKQFLEVFIHLEIIQYIFQSMQSKFKKTELSSSINQFEQIQIFF
jgi:hypothetical protein